MTKLKSCLLKSLLLCFLMCFPIAAFAGSGADFNAKNAQCKQYDKDENTCLNAGCKFTQHKNDATGLIYTSCVAPSCPELSLSDDCQSYKGKPISYCKVQTGGTANRCVSKQNCAELENRLAEDDYGNECESGTMDGINLIVYNDQYVGTDTNTDDFCKSAYKWRNKLLTVADRKKYCSKYPANSTQYNTCYGGITYQTIYNEQCTGGNNTCTDGRISSVVVTGSNTRSYKCICPYGTTEKNGKCVSSGGSGITCKTVNSYVESFDQFGSGNICVDQNACSYADCSENGDAEPYDKNSGRLFYTGVDDIVVNGEHTGQYGSNGKAWAYTGTCNNKSTDVFCIDPIAKYHDNTAQYSCKASMKEGSNIDSGFIKIYQLALDEYQELYKSHKPLCPKNDLSNDCTAYQGIHFAFRFWTFYSGIGRTTDFYEEDGLGTVKNAAIAEGFYGTARRAMGTSDNTYFMVTKSGQPGGGLINGYDIPNPAAKKGYWDAVKFFKATAAGTSDIWVSTLEFKKIAADRNTKIATIRLDGIQGLKDSRFMDMNFVSSIYCKDCTILDGLDPSKDYLKAGVDSVTFKVKYTGSSFTVGVYYYDRRDGKNVILATAAKADDYQRLIFTTASELSASNVRRFKYEKSFDEGNDPCRIEGGRLYGNDGKQLTGDKDYIEFEQQCCNTHIVDNVNGTHDSYCAVLKNRFGTNDDRYKAACTEPYKSIWAKKDCPMPCEANTTNPKSGECAEVENDTIVISDLTDDNSLGLTGNYVNSDHYCLSCIGEKNSADASGSSYLLNPNNPYCKTYCIEEYKFGVPGHLSTKNPNAAYGRYLELTVNASSKRICYTDPVNKINYSQFKTDANNKIKDIKNEITELNKRRDAYNAAKTAYDNGDSFNQSPGDICKTTKEEEAPTCPYGTTYGTSKCPNSCEECTQAVNGGCVASRCINAAGKSKQTVSVDCDGQPRPTSYSYTSGGYTHSSAGSCNSCTANNGSREAVLKGFKDDYDAQFNKVKGMIDEYKAIVNAYNSCYEFGTGICEDGTKSTNPYVEFSYDESYYMSVLKTDARLAGTWTSAGSSTEFYNKADGSKGYCSFSGTSESAKYSQEKFTTFEVDNNNQTINAKDNDFNVQINNFTYKTETKAAQLKPVATWYTKIGDGHATLKKEKNSITLGQVLPISRICLDGQNTFKYTLSFKQVGQPIAQCYTNPPANGEGRLNTIIKEITEDKKSNGAISKYVCDYTIDNKTCEGCEDTYYFRPISLSDVFPKTGKLIEEESKNASNPHRGDYRVDTSIKGEKLMYERGVSPNWATEKGKAAQKNIEELGEKAYTKEHLEYSYTITPAGMKQIRAYNQDKNYGDFDMECGDNWYCSSNFLTLIEQNKYSGVKQNKRSPNYEQYNGTVWR